MGIYNIHLYEGIRKKIIWRSHLCRVKIAYIKCPKIAYIKCPKIAYIKCPKIAYIKCPKIACSKCPKILNTLFHNVFRLKFACYAVVS